MRIQHYSAKKAVRWNHGQRRLRVTDRWRIGHFVNNGHDGLKCVHMATENMNSPLMPVSNLSEEIIYSNSSRTKIQGI